MRWDPDMLAGEDPVLEWVRGTGLRPVFGALPPAEAAAFTVQYAALLRQAYPRSAAGTVFPFTRTFVVAHRAAGDERAGRSVASYSPAGNA